MEKAIAMDAQRRKNQVRDWERCTARRWQTISGANAF